jgi:hypothetical protein
MFGVLLLYHFPNMLNEIIALRRQRALCGS